MQDHDKHCQNYPSQPHHPHHHHHYSKRVPTSKQYSLDINKDNLNNDNMNTCDMIDPLSAMDANVSDNTRDQIRSSDSSVPSPISSQYMGSNRMPPSDQKRCQNKPNQNKSAQIIDCFPKTTSNRNFQLDNDQGNNSSETTNNVQKDICKDQPHQPSPISNNKINHYHKIHKNVRNRARKFDDDRSSKSAFLGGLFTDLTASEDTLLLENGEVHQMSERSKMSSKDNPTINMPPIFGSISNINNNNSALLCESPGPSGAISKNTRPARKSVNIKSPTKEAVPRRTNDFGEKSSNVDNVQKDKDKRRRKNDIPQNRSVSDQIGIEKAVGPSAKGKKAPQVRISFLNWRINLKIK